MGYRYDMSKEREPKRKQLLPEGLRDFKITACKEAMSKNGNPMFVFLFVDEGTNQEEEVYAVSSEGKRWFLKRILEACDAPTNADGVFDWDIPDVLNKEVMGLVEHEPNEYINRKGETIKGVQHKIVDVQPCRWNE